MEEIDGGSVVCWVEREEVASYVPVCYRPLASHMPPDSYQAATKATADGAGLRGGRWQAYVGCGQAMKKTSHLATLPKQSVGLRRSPKQSPVSSKPDISHFLHWRTALLICTFPI